MSAIWAQDLLADETDEAALALATEVGGWPDLPPADRRAFTLVVRASLDAQAEGATRLRLDTVEARLARLGAGDEDRARAARLAGVLGTTGGKTGKTNAEIPEALRPFIGRPGDYVPFILDGGCLYHERILRLEARLAAALAGRLAAGEIPILPAQLAAAVAAAGAAPERPWTAPQQAAIEAALSRRLTVIAGGPGTGKTAVIGGIVRAWAALGIPNEAIAVAAPTGKAANRIAELLSSNAPSGNAPSGNAPQPTTLHRLLGAGGGSATTRRSRFRHHENHVLPHAAVIVDEASMVGLALMEQLVRALAPDARLVLVGDADQLPAVEAGSVFRDLAPLAVRLRESHRMDPTDPAGAAVLDAARAIAAGDLGTRGTPAAQHPAELPAAGFACLDPGPARSGLKGRRQLAAFLDHWRAVHLHPPEEAWRAYQVRGDGQLGHEDARAVADLLDHHRRRRILTVTRVGPMGAEAINRTLDRRAAPEGENTADEIRPGTPVLITVNDHERGLYNGDAGIVVRLTDATDAGGNRPDRRWLAAVFPRAGALVPFPLAGLRGMLEIAYASTVHKAQGSELDHAALVLPETDLALCTRELIYTAVTRVRRSIVVVGRRPILEQAIARPLERSSGLADRLAASADRLARPG